MNTRKRVILNSIIMFIILFNISGLSGLSVIRKEAINTSSIEGIRILRSIENMIDKEKLIEVLEEKSIENDYYITLEGQLTDIVDSNDLLYLYTYGYNSENKLEYGVVANSLNDGTLDTLGQDIDSDDISEEIKAAINNGESTTSNIVEDDE